MLFLNNAITKLHKNFHALSHRNFRIFWFGQIISLIGTWMQTISLPWLAYTLTHSPFLLGLVGALQFTPMLFFSLFAGVLVDKIEKKKIIIFTQIVLALCALAISILVLTKQVQYWHLLVIALIIGFANTIDMPGRLTFIIEMIGKEDLMNAIALNSTIFNLARIIGPSIAGIVMQAVGIGFCFLINAISFIPVITGLFFIKPLFCISNKSNNKILKDIGEGLKYIYSQNFILDPCRCFCDRHIRDEF